jgi:flagellin
MSLRINTNMASISARKSLDIQQERTDHALRALSSGSRITRAADDAAGLAISQKLGSEVRGLAVARRNSENAVSFIQVGEGGLNEINNILVRLKELGVQSASDTLGDEEREFVDVEAQQMIAEVDRIANSTKFGSTNLLNGDSNKLEFQVGTGNTENDQISFKSNANATASSLNIKGLGFDSKSGAREALEYLDEALTKVGGMRANFGALQNRLDATIRNLDTQQENFAAASSRIKDADIAHETAELASAQVLQQASVSMLAQANQSTANALRLIG